jgi:hypothetical protein
MRHASAILDGHSCYDGPDAAAAASSRVGSEPITTRRTKEMRISLGRSRWRAPSGMMSWTDVELPPAQLRIGADGLLARR